MERKKIWIYDTILKKKLKEKKQTWVCSLVRPLIHKICPVLLTSCDNDPLLPSSTSETLPAISSGGPEPQVKVFGILLVGIVVINWPHTRVPKPRKIHHNHWSMVRLAVENA